MHVLSKCLDIYMYINFNNYICFCYLNFFIAYNKYIVVTHKLSLKKFEIAL